MGFGVFGSGVEGLILGSDTEKYRTKRCFDAPKTDAQLQHAGFTSVDAQVGPFCP